MTGPAHATGLDLPDAERIAAQLEVYNSNAPGSIFALQPYRNDMSLTGADGLEVTLTSMNPGVNAWFILRVAGGDHGRARFYHLENADPAAWQVSLAMDGDAPAIRLESADNTVDCAPWQGRNSQLEAARAEPLPYAPLCDGAMYLRNQVSGNRTSREAIAEFLRENVIFGDSLVNLIKGTLFQDAYRESSEEADTEDAGSVVAALGQANLSRFPVMRTAPGFDLVGAEGGMEAGSWYAVEDAPGIYASMMQPGMISDEILNRRGETNWLDGVERGANVHLVAFDMRDFEIGYELGTAHPALGWSSRPHGAGRDWSIPGPDGIDSPSPLIMTGMLSPSLTDRVAATFTAGYKRDHGAFRYGDMATFNHGHHYGFMVNGTVLSRLWPGLSTIYVTHDGSFGMTTWTEALNEELLPHLRFARQNGVPLIHPDPETGESVPGDRVTQWGAGNWSGSADAQLRTLRAGSCLREVGGRQFLIYAYFSTATPSAMARTFQAYDCDYAMLLDMNSQEHTYMALYPQIEDGDDWIEAEHLVPGMASIDQQSRAGVVPRFVGFADNRDFFYLLRRE
ncbi:MAG: hypothetical protein R6U99_14090 [Nioella sp.]